MINQKISTQANYKCANCSIKLISGTTICPNCGSRNRDISLKVSDSVGIHDQTRVKTKRIVNGKTEIIHIQKIGDDYYRKTGKWNFLHRIIDKLQDYYYELIKDGETGEIVIEKTEKLSNHQGYGSAKLKKK